MICLLFSFNTEFLAFEASGKAAYPGLSSLCSFGEDQPGALGTLTGASGPGLTGPVPCAQV